MSVAPGAARAPGLQGLDVAGATLVPAFIDSHVHMVAARPDAGPILSAAEQRAVVETAHGRGLPVGSHA